MTKIESQRELSAMAADHQIEVVGPSLFAGPDGSAEALSAPPQDLLGVTEQSCVFGRGWSEAKPAKKKEKFSRLNFLEEHGMLATSKRKNPPPQKHGMLAASKRNNAPPQKAPPWRQLPLEVLMGIIHILPERDLRQVSLCSKGLKQVVDAGCPDGSVSWFSYRKQVAQGWERIQGATLAMSAYPDPQGRSFEAKVLAEMLVEIIKYKKGGPPALHYVFEDRAYGNFWPSAIIDKHFDALNEVAKATGASVCVPAASANLSLYSAKWPSLLFAVRPEAPFFSATDDSGGDRQALQRRTFLPPSVYRAEVDVDGGPQPQADWQRIVREAIVGPRLQHLIVHAPAPCFLLKTSGLRDLTTLKLHRVNGSVGRGRPKTHVHSILPRGYFHALQKLTLENYKLSLREDSPWPANLHTLTLNECSVVLSEGEKAVKMPKGLRHLELSSTVFHFNLNLFHGEPWLEKITIAAGTKFLLGDPEEGSLAITANLAHLTFELDNIGALESARRLAHASGGALKHITVSKLLKTPYFGKRRKQYHYMLDFESFFASLPPSVTDISLTRRRRAGYLWLLTDEKSGKWEQSKVLCEESGMDHLVRRAAASVRACNDWLTEPSVATQMPPWSDL